MAYTKIHAIKATINKAIDYICNPHKTDDRILIDSFATGPQTAAFDFKAALSKTTRPDDILAFHLIQSFAPGEVSQEEAHIIGKELADRLLKGRYSYVITTHIDKNHIHNHIIFCAADNIDNKKYYSTRSSYRQIRKLSDELCKEHGLSVIVPGQKRGMEYKEWYEDKKGNSWKTILKDAIDECITKANDYSEFCKLISEKGYEIKGINPDGFSGKYIAFRPLNGKQFVRGSARSLGEEYTRESIIHRITNKTLQENISSTSTANENKKYTESGLINLRNDRIASSPGLTNWAEIKNLQTVASAYANAGSIAELTKQIEAKKALVTSTKASLVALEKKHKIASEVLKYAQQYEEYHKYDKKLKTSKDPDRYYREHDSQLTLFYGAENYLISHGIDPSKMDVSKMKAAYHNLEKQIKDLKNDVAANSRNVSSLQKDLLKLNEYFITSSNIKKQVKNIPGHSDPGR